MTRILGALLPFLLASAVSIQPTALQAQAKPDPASAPRSMDANGPAAVWFGAEPPDMGSVPGIHPDRSIEPLSVLDFGAKGDGATDDTAAFQAAITAVPAGGTLVIPSANSSYRIRATLTIASPITIIGKGGTILFDFPPSTASSAGQLFNITSSQVHLSGVHIDGTGLPVGPTPNRYAIAIAASRASRCRDILIQKCRFTNLTQCAGTIPATTTVTHAIYANRVDDLRILDNVVDTISGAGVFLVNTSRATIRGNGFVAFGWSGVWLNNANTHWEVDGNTFSGTTLIRPSYWGGAIDVMGQTSDAQAPGLPDVDGVIINNRFIGGVYRYGQVVRISSGQQVIIRRNVFDQCDADQSAVAGSLPGTAGPGGHNHLIVCTVRDITRNNGPHKQVSISDNLFIASGAGWQIPIYTITTSGSNLNTTVCEGLLVENNRFVCVDGRNFFQSALVLHGFNAGYRDIIIRGNHIRCTPNSVTNYIPGSVPGAIVLLANAGKTVQGVVIQGNIIERYGGPGANNNDTALNIYSDVSGVDVRDNVFLNFFRDITVKASNTGDITIHQNTHNRNAGGSDYNLRGVATQAPAGTQITGNPAIQRP